MSAREESTLLLIDAHSLIHRTFHALPPLTTKEGKPANALYGLSSILLRILREERPTYAAALLDRPEPTFRKEQYPAYKAKRPKTPDALVGQIIEARALFERFGIKVIERPGVEADDLIATLVEKFRATPHLKIVILTGDTDTLQLVSDPEVVVRFIRRGISDTVTMNEAAIEERYGLLPEQFVDYKALVGDPSDNIPGVPGIGPKTARDLLVRYSTLEGIYRDLGVDAKLRKKMESFRAQAVLSRELITLKRDVDLGEHLEDFCIEDRPEELEAYFEELGFRTLLERLRGSKEGKHRRPPISQGKMF